VTLDELFGGDDLDARFEAIPASVREGLGGRVTVAESLDLRAAPPEELATVPILDDNMEPIDPAEAELPEPVFTINLALTWNDADAGGFEWQWKRSEPTVLYWISAEFGENLRGTHLFGPLAAMLVDFLDTELGIEELYAQGPSDELKPILVGVGMVEVEREDAQTPFEAVLWGGPIKTGRMREHTRWRKGEVPEPGWRTGGETRPEIAEDLTVERVVVDGQPSVEPGEEEHPPPELPGPEEVEQPVT
jgi:hypothetical protein